MRVDRFSPDNYTSAQHSHPGRNSGKSWPAMPSAVTSTASNAYPVDQTMFLPLIANNFQAPIRGVSLLCFTGGSAGAQVKGGVWRMDKNAMQPFGTAIAFSPAVDITGTGEISMMLNVPVNPDDFDVLALGVVFNTVTTQASIMVQATSDNSFSGFTGRLNTASSTQPTRFQSAALVFAADMAQVPVGAVLIGQTNTPSMFAQT